MQINKKKRNIVKIRRSDSVVSIRGFYKTTLFLKIKLKCAHLDIARAHAQKPRLLRII